MKVISFLTILCLTWILNPVSRASIPNEIQTVFDEIGVQNDEVISAQMKTSFDLQTLRGSKSRLWPQLSLSATANKAEDNSVSNSSTSLDSGTSSPSGSLSSQSSSSVTDLNNVNDGWVTQATLGYYLFTKFAVQEDIQRSELSLQGSKIKESEVYDEKKAQFLQLLLEWQHLSKAIPPLLEAQKLLGKVKKFSKSRSQIFYSRRDRAKLEERESLIEYRLLQAQEGKHLAYSAIKALVPDMTETRLEKLKEYEIIYPLPTRDKLDEAYLSQSRSHKRNQLDIQASQSYLYTSEWNRPWIPTIYLSTSYSYSGDYDGLTNDGGVSSSLVMSFNLFDGFYSQARLEQSRVAVKAAELKSKMEQSRRVLHLKYERMNALVKKAEARNLGFVAKKNSIKYQSVQKKHKQGVSSSLELSASALEYSKTLLDAIKPLKDHYKSLLNLAVQLNEFHKVTLNEKN